MVRAADDGLERGAIGAGDPERMAENRGRLDAGLVAETARRSVDVGPGRLERNQPRAPRYVVGTALYDDPPAGEIDDAVAALRLVHVVGGDEHGQAVARHVVNEIPELAPC